MTRANMYAGVRECAQWTPYVLSIMGICGSARGAGETERTCCPVRVEVLRQEASTRVPCGRWSRRSRSITEPDREGRNPGGEGRCGVGTCRGCICVAWVEKGVWLEK